jgi:hypothetical protein
VKEIRESFRIIRNILFFISIIPKNQLKNVFPMIIIPTGTPQSIREGKKIEMLC